MVNFITYFENYADKKVKGKSRPGSGSLRLPIKDVTFSGTLTA